MRAVEASRWLVLGQVLFFFMVVTCLVIDPSRTALIRGLSYYGTRFPTFVPYAVGFAFAIGFSSVGLARIRTRARRVRRFRAAVFGVLTLMAFIPLTPYNLDIVFDWLHIGATTLLFAATLAVGAWLVARVIRARSARFIFLLEAVTAVAVLAAQAGMHPYMLPSELAYQLLVTCLIVQAMRSLAAEAREA